MQRVVQPPTRFTDQFDSINLPQQRFQDKFRFNSRDALTDTRMNPCAKGHVRNNTPLQIELFRTLPLPRIPIGGRQKQQHL